MRIGKPAEMVMIVASAFLLGVGMTGAIIKITSEPVTVSQHFKIMEDSPLFRCDYHGNRACTADDVPATDVEITVSLSGDPLADCYALLAAGGYADSLAGPMCKIVEENLG